MTGMTAVTGDVAVERLDVSAQTIPTDAPESDGTLEWDSTTIVVVEAHAGGLAGTGWTYGDAAAGSLIESKLASAVAGRNAMDVQAAWAAMTRAIRNDGRPGISSMAICPSFALRDGPRNFTGKQFVRIKEIHGLPDASHSVTWPCAVEMRPLCPDMNIDSSRIVSARSATFWISTLTLFSFSN